MAVAAAAAAATTIRALRAEDLAAVVAIDAASRGRTRREYIERRLRAAQRDAASHAQFAAVDEAGTLVGCMLARRLAGEFGDHRPALRLELIGVRGARRGQGVGSALFDALAAWGQRHGAGEMRTAASWRDADILAWLDAVGFDLAGEVVVERGVAGGAAPDDDGRLLREGHGGDVDYGRSEANDRERQQRGRADVRAMVREDLDAITRIDRDLVGRDRREYIAARLAEALGDGGLRVSLTARLDGAIVGYLMARADFGDFGRAEPVAVIDTLGVDADAAHRGVGTALVDALLGDLGALGVERVETIVALRDPGLLGFFEACGFAAAERLSFVRPLEVRR